jgi:transposase
VHWAQGKETLCTSYQWFLARWAKKLSWTQVAEAFCTSWESVYKSVQMAVYWGLARRILDGVEAIGVDEISWHKNHKYLTLVYDIGVGSKRLLYIARDRTEASLRGFFEQLGEEKSKKLVYICSDMWAPYLKVIAEKAAQAKNILDRFHIMKKFNEAIDQVRRDEARRMKQEGGEPLLVHARWCLLKRTENLTERQASKLQKLMRYNLRSVRAYLLREEFQRFWQYVRPSCAARFLEQWCKVAMRSRLEPLKKVVGMLRNHRELILNWFSAQGTMSSGTVEGLNHKAKVVFRNAYGYRQYNTVEIALYHTLGALPAPEFTHRFL